MIRLLLAALLAVTPTPTPTTSATASAAAVAPALTVQPAQAAPGTSVQVRGSGWPAGVTVQLQICGQQAVHGSADCDPLSAVTAPVSPTGVLEAGLTVAYPPTTCPCVLHAGTPGLVAPLSVNAPLDVLGNPTGPVRPDAPPVRVDVLDAELTGGPSWSELFGWQTTRTLVLALHNAGATEVKGAPLAVGWGAGSKPDTPVTAPSTVTIPAGATVTLRIPVSLPAASFGRFVVGGSFAGSVPFETAFSTYPYALLGVNLLALLLLVVGVRRVLRRRARARAALRPSDRGYHRGGHRDAVDEAALDHFLTGEG